MVFQDQRYPFRLLILIKRTKDAKHAHLKENQTHFLASCNLLNMLH